MRRRWVAGEVDVAGEDDSVCDSTCSVGMVRSGLDETATDKEEVRMSHLQMSHGVGPVGHEVGMMRS